MPPSTEVTVVRVANQIARRGCAMLIGASITSGGIGKER